MMSMDFQGYKPRRGLQKMWWPPIYEFFYDLFYKIAKGFGLDEYGANFVAKAMCILIVFIVCIHIIYFVSQTI